MARFCNSTPRARIIHHKIDVITENCSSKTIKTDLDLVSRKLTRILCPGGLPSAVKPGVLAPFHNIRARHVLTYLSTQFHQNSFI